MNDILNISDAAIKKIYDLVIEENNPQLKLRVFVKALFLTAVKNVL